MRAQTTVLAAFMATVLIIIMLFLVFIEFIPLATTKTTRISMNIDIEKIVSSKTNWTAKELVDAIIAKYNPEYVNVSIKIYNILEDNRIVYSDVASFILYNVSRSDLTVYRYVITNLARNGYFAEYIIEVGFK